MKNIIKINGEERELTNEELKKLGYKKCDFCDKIFYAPDLTPIQILVKEKYWSYKFTKMGYHIARKSYIICDECLDRIVNVIIGHGSEKPKITR